MNKWYSRTLLLVSVCVLVALSYWVGVSRDDRLEAICRNNYKFLNSDVLCGSKDVIKKTGYEKTKQDIFSYTENKKKLGQVDVVSVYFRDLIHGPVLGINDQFEYSPASQLKLPLALVFLRSAEEQEGLLNKKIIYQGTTSVGEQRVVPQVSAVSGKEYSLEELLRIMITYSDNASYEALEAFISNDPNRYAIRKRIFQEIGLIDPRDRIEDTISVRGYSSIFRLLYNVSYLEKEQSEKLLSWLVDSTYSDGIKAGVPTEVLVANKFGERIFSDKTKQLSDCGIVYYPKNPYLLCIMVKGNNWDFLTSTISDISKMIYIEVDSRQL